MAQLCLGLDQQCTGGYGVLDSALDGVAGCIMLSADTCGEIGQAVR
jgi:hypothetical protein